VSGSAAAAAGLSYFGAQLTNIDWGTLAVIAVPLVHLGLDYITKLLTNNK